MTEIRVQKSGKITIPKDIREQLSYEVGDVANFRVLGPGRVEIELTPKGTLPDSKETPSVQISHDRRLLSDERQQEAAPQEA